MAEGERDGRRSCHLPVFGYVKRNVSVNLLNCGTVFVHGLSVLPRKKETGGGLLPGGYPFAAPNIPVAKSDFQHGFGGLMEPAVFAFGEVAADGGNGIAAAEVNVGGFPAHVIEELFLVALPGQGADF